MCGNDARCQYCGEVDCDKDCGELAMIYRERQRESLRDIDLDDVELDYETGHWPPYNDDGVW